MDVAKIKKTAEDKMKKSVEALKADLAKVRTGRAHTGLLDHIRVDYYGPSVPLNQVSIGIASRSPGESTADSLTQEARQRAAQQTGDR